MGHNFNNIRAVIHDDTASFGTSEREYIPFSQDLEEYLANTPFPQTIEVFANHFSGTDIRRNNTVSYHEDVNLSYVYAKLREQLRNIPVKSVESTEPLPRKGFKSKLLSLLLAS